MQLHTQKQLKYFDEVIRLHVEEGLGEDSIAMRIPLGHTTIGRWITAYNSGEIVRPSKSALVNPAEGIQEMYDSGISMRAISRITGLTKSTICRKIANFASENKEQDMPQKQTETKPMAKDAQARIAELEAKLRKAELARDAYDEMINVAEAKFNIPIRKKAGAKR